MSRLTNWLLIPPVSSRLSERYRHYRYHGASSLSAALGCLWMILAWMFIPSSIPADNAFARATVNSIRISTLTSRVRWIPRATLFSPSGYWRPQRARRKKRPAGAASIVCRTCVNTTTSGLTGYPTGWATKQVI